MGSAPCSINGLALAVEVKIEGRDESDKGQFPDLIHQAERAVTIARLTCGRSR